ncbi:MAG TPA: mycothiol synthase [Ornithinibacter sp.]|nr:mycothiol synthase [Ornithinibacter sp.]
MARTERVLEVDEPTTGLLRALWSRAADADGVGAVSEAFRLAVGPPRDGVVHLLRHADDGTLVGYAQVAEAGTPDAVAELVVDPAHRRRGHGRALLDAALAQGARSVWAHGMLAAADALARAAGLEKTRSLHLMRRPLTAADASDLVLPEGFSVRSFLPGQDDDTWVRLNAAAFARHPEQGRLTVGDLHERMAQPWFDPAGLLLVVEDATGSVVAFHWTKVEPGGTRGEVYVVGVDPDHQGRGLGGPLTRLGLAHLARLGLGEVELYVDGDNTAARRTYERLGFTDAAVDGQYTLAAT